MTASSVNARALLAEVLNVNPDAIDDAASVGSHEAWDSLGHMRLVLSLEQRLQRELTSDEIAGLVGLADITRLLESHC